ncbi:hypothetical protein GALL_177140 [mine drainage metagenome]|uniref:Uncharacterized protein n=1 Tax=mine drainage metagenome TaxID=410659 RepID=A0A1J5S862_9ZZZZ
MRRTDTWQVGDARDGDKTIGRGRPARLNDEQLQNLGRALRQRPTEHGTELWALKRVGVLIERLYGVKFGQARI